MPESDMLEIEVIDSNPPTARMKNIALEWMKSKLPKQAGQIVFAGIWQDSWKLDFPHGESSKTRAVLAMYDDASTDAYLILYHSGVYCEITTDPPATARRRAWEAGFGDVVVGNDGNQTYLWALKSGRPK